MFAKWEEAMLRKVPWVPIQESVPQGPEALRREEWVLTPLEREFPLPAQSSRQPGSALLVSAGRIPRSRLILPNSDLLPAGAV
jgi:hypothetical protein